MIHASTLDTEPRETLICNICADFGLSPCAISRQPGCSRPVYRIQAHDRVLCLKSHRTDEDRMLCNVRLLRNLQLSGFGGFPEFLVALGGSPVVSAGGSAWTLTQWVTQDIDIVPISAVTAGYISRLLGRFHTVSLRVRHNMPFPNVALRMAAITRACRFVESLGIGSFSGEIGLRFAEILPLYKEEAVRVRGALADSESLLCRLWQTLDGSGMLVHGDISPDNAVVTADGCTHLLDWDDLRADVHIGSDLVQMFWRLAVPTEDPRCVIEQYSREHQLSADEARLFPIFASSVHIFAYCAQRLISQRWTDEDALIAEPLLSSTEACIERPWEAATWF